jgi:LPS-assembly protein
MSDRGVKTAGEFRYVIDDQSRGAIMMDFLEDDKIDDGTDARQTYGFSSTDTRTNTDRWWFRMKHDQVLPYGVTAKLDLDVVSDADYLQEFQDGFTGYDATNEYFSDAFGRSLDSYDDTTRKNSLLLSKTWSSYSMSVQGLWYDDVEARQQDTTDTTLQTLPSVEFDALRQKIGDTSFYWTLDSETRSFYRQDTTDTLVNGQRLDIYPKLYYPTRIGKHFSFEPYLGVRGTGWHTNDFTDDYGNDDEFRFRGIYDTGASLSTTIDRVFNLDAGFAEKLRHEIIPQIDYAFRPDVDQNDLPYFDDLDELSQKNKITWSLTHVFTARTTTQGADGSEKPVYKELAWFKLYQDYDMVYDADNDVDTGGSWQEIKLKYELNPSGILSSNGEIGVNPYDGHLTEAKVGVTIKDNRGDKFYSSYRYDIDEYQTWVNQLTIQITDEVMAYYCLESDLENRSTIEQKAGVEFTRDCWGMALEYSEASGDKSIAAMIRLTGIGEFGTQ